MARKASIEPNECAKRAGLVLWSQRLPSRGTERRLSEDRFEQDVRAKETEVMATDIHAEHVGSLLRQPWLLTARADYKDGKITEGELRATEDRAAAENIENRCDVRHPRGRTGRTGPSRLRRFWFFPPRPFAHERRQRFHHRPIQVGDRICGRGVVSTQ